MTSGPTPDPATGLHVEESGGAGPSDRRLVLVHGFTQTGRLWGGFDRALGPGLRLVRIDLPGHGGSAEVRADVPTAAGLVVDAGRRAVYLGYSLGARVTLQAALDRPREVAAAVLVSGTPGLGGDAERVARRAADAVLADRLDPPDGSTGQTVDEFLAGWTALPLFGDLPVDGLGLAERRRNTAAGLAGSLRLAGSGSQMPLWDRLGELRDRAAPVLLVTGARDARYTALAERMAGSIGPTATHVVVDDADHAPHLQHPAEVAAVVRAWVDALPPAVGRP